MLILRLSAKGRQVGRLELPVPPGECGRQLEAIQERPLSVCGVESPIPALDWQLSHIKPDDTLTLQKLNQLAEAVDGMNAAGHYHLHRALSTDYPQSLDQILQAAARIKPSGLDSFEIIPGVAAHEALGRWLVEHDGLEAKVPESLRRYLKYRNIGVEYCNTHGGVFLTGGYAGIREGALKQVLEEQRVLRLTLAASEKTVMLGFPALEDELERAAWALGVEDLAQAGIIEAGFSDPRLAALIPLDTVTVEDAGELARYVQDMEPQEDRLSGFLAALETERPGTFAEALDLARQQAMGTEQGIQMGGMV